jgi:hypothetical protein
MEDTLKKPITSSAGLLVQRMLPLNSEGCASNTEPSVSVFFLIFSKKNIVKLIKVVRMYKTIHY